MGTYVTSSNFVSPHPQPSPRCTFLLRKLRSCLRLLFSSRAQWKRRFCFLVELVERWLHNWRTYIESIPWKIVLESMNQLSRTNLRFFLTFKFYLYLFIYLFCIKIIKYTIIMKIHCIMKNFKDILKHIISSPLYQKYNCVRNFCKKIDCTLLSYT